MKHRKVVALVAAAAGLASLAIAGPASAATFTVNFAADASDPTINGTCDVGGGACTLRAAIQEANANVGPTDLINFAIPGAGPHTLGLTSELPLITQPVTINGYSQPGAAPNTARIGTNADLRIVLDGSGLVEANGFGVQGGGTTIRGLDIRGFNEDTPALFDGGGIVFFNLAANTGNRVTGNFIGTNVAGTAAVRNESGGVLAFNAARVTVGGNSPAERNLISGNGRDGVSLSSENDVEGNLIGVAADGASPLGNGQSGVEISGSDNTVGGAVPNVIANNGLDGITLFTGAGNRFTRNSIFDNGGLGIDLDNEIANNGVTPNDPGDADTGDNNLQNYPELQKATNGSGATTVQGSLSSTPGQSFEVHFYASPAADPSGFGEGRSFLGEISVSDSDGDGAIPLTFVSSPALSAGQRVTATATSAGGDTSEFSNAVTVNTPPSAAPDSFSTPEDTALSVPDGEGDLLANDADADGNAFSAALVEGPAHGTVELGADGSFTYSPQANFHGDDSFRYLVSDGTDESAPATVAVSVASVNDLPVVTALVPKSGSKTKDHTPKVRALATDTESELAKGDLRLSIDGKRKKGFSYKTASDKLRWTADPLAAGAHKVKVVAEDADGGRTKRSWKFKVTG